MVEKTFEYQNSVSSITGDEPYVFFYPVGVDKTDKIKNLVQPIVHIT